MSEKAEILRRALVLVENPDTWTRGAGARAVDGRPLSSSDPDACQFCAVGAVNKAARDLGASRFDVHSTHDLLDRIALREHSDDIIGVNDTVGREAVVAIFRTALAEVDPSP